MAKKQKKHLAVLTGDRINEVFLEEKFSRFARRPIESGCEVTVRRGFTGTTVFLKKRNHFNLKFKSLKKNPCFSKRSNFDRNAVSDALVPPPPPPPALRVKPPAWLGPSPRWIASPLKYPGYGPEMF